MKNKFLLLLVENAAIELIALFLVFRFSENGAGIYSVVFIIILALTGLQGYVQIVRPYTDKMEELEKAAEESQESEHIRREFVANVSHELKTPLMSISGYAELIMNHMVSAENTPEFAGRIYQEANRLSTLVADIIKLSKLDEQEDCLPMEEEVDLWMMANDVNWQLQQKAEERNITVKLKGESVKIHGNRQLLSEIVYNLVDNAIKYNVENGKVHIHVHRKGDHAEFVVKDTGVGIAAADRERVFERFYRVDKSRSREIEGTGLGLSIVKHGVAMHKGEIKVDSALGKGTKITVVFPL